MEPEEYPEPYRSRAELGGIMNGPRPHDEQEDDKEPATRTAIVCGKCGQVVFSRAHYDFVKCKCRTVFADGGDYYNRFGFDPKVPFSLSEIKFKVASAALFMDWNSGEDCYLPFDKDAVPEYVESIVETQPALSE